MITERQRRAIIEDTVAKIELGQIVPIIGDDIFYIKPVEGDGIYKEEEKDKEVKIHEYIVRRLILRNENGGDDSKKVYEKACKGFKGMTYLKKRFEDEYLNLTNEIKNLYREENIIKRAYLSKDVDEFLKKGKFPLIITTSYSNILEDKLGEKFKSVYYMKERKSGQDIGQVNENGGDNRLEEPTVYHILGGMSYEFVLTENDFLQYLHHLHDTNSSPQRLLEYINNRRYILALGCNIPDWTLRFLLYSFVTDKRENTRVSFNGGVIDTKEDKDLEEFLLNIDYYYEYEDINQKRLFISELNTKLLPEERRVNVFVSVLQKDLDSDLYGPAIRDKIVSVLKCKYDVWFCEEKLDKTKSGQEHWVEIEKGLEECDYFMPIITPNVLNKFRVESEKKEITVEPQPERIGGIIAEWQKAFKLWNDRGFKSDFVKPFMIEETLDNIKEFFLNENASEGIKSLRQLVFGHEKEKGQFTGLQIVNYNDISKLKL